MTVEQKGVLVGQVISRLRFEAERRKKPFDEGDTFFRSLLQVGR
jgi:hypothetical protein